MTQRILILSASVGAGHLRAAQALELVLRETHPGAHVENVDVMQLTNRLFRRLYARSYLDLVNRAPHVLGYLYDLLDRPSKSGKNRGDRLRQMFETMNLKRLIHLLQRQPWDLVLNTHFLPAEIIALLRQQGRLKVQQVTVTTDFETHKLWVNQPCDHYFTATEEGAAYLRHWGVPAGDISVTGIPIHPEFVRPKSKEELRVKHGLAPDRPVVLQLAGGFGVGPIEQTYRSLLEVKVPLQVVAVCGKNEETRKKLERVPVPAPHQARVLGFTSEIDEWMGLADLVVSKPGGLTTSESLARGLVMVILNPTPGQETRNSDYLLENGAAIKVNSLATLGWKVTRLLEDPSRLAALRANASRIARPRAAHDVVERSLALIGGKPESRLLARSLK